MIAKKIHTYENKWNEYHLTIWFKYVSHINALKTWDIVVIRENRNQRILKLYDFHILGSSKKRSRISVLKLEDPQLGDSRWML